MYIYVVLLNACIGLATMLPMCTRYYQQNAEDNKPSCQSYGSGLHAVSLKVTTKLTRSVPESIGLHYAHYSQKALRLL